MNRESRKKLSKAAKDWMCARNVIAEALAEIDGQEIAGHHFVNAEAVIARLARSQLVIISAAELDKLEGK